MNNGVIKDRCMYAKVGRGAISLFDVSSHDELHRYLSRWLELVPAEMQIIPLMNRKDTADFLSSAFSRNSQSNRWSEQHKMQLTQEQHMSTF